MRYNGKMKYSQGFTLVELAIVLTIIGLIVGGILGGQELVHASKINAVVTQVNKISVAIDTFETKYNALPGDIDNATSYWGAGTSCPTNAGSGTCNGDANGLTLNSTYTGSESTFAWQHLALAGLIPGSYNPNWPAGAVTGGTYIPEWPMEGLGGYFGYATPYTTVWYETYGNHHYIWIGETHTTAYSSGYMNRYFDCPDAYNLDTKMDDGLPGMGRVMVPRAYGCTSNTSASASATAAYDPASTGTTWFAIQMD